MLCGLVLLRLFVLCLPRSLYLILGRWGGWLAYSLLAGERRKTESNLKLALGSERSDTELRAISRAVFGHLGQNLVEWISLAKFTPSNIDSIIEVRGLERMRAGLAQGRGVILIGSHFGNWELICPVLVMKLGVPEITVVGRRIYFDKYNELIVRARREKGVRTFYRDDPPRRILGALKQNQVVGLVPDQDVDSVDGIFVNFFGRPAYTPTGPARLARAARAVLIPCFMIRQGSRYRFEICDPIEVDMARGKDEAIREATEGWSRVVEDTIRRYPEQWAWMHRRWKTQENAPKDEGSGTKAVGRGTRGVPDE